MEKRGRWNETQWFYRMKVNSKALDIPVVTAIISNFTK